MKHIVLESFQIATLMNFTSSPTRKGEKHFYISANYRVPFKESQSPAYKWTCSSLQGNTNRNQYYYSISLQEYLCALVCLFFFLYEEERCVIYRN